MRRPLLGEVGLLALAAGPPAPLALPNIHIVGVTCRRRDIDAAIDALRAANVPPNADGSYTMKTAAGNVIRVRSSSGPVADFVGTKIAEIP